MKESRTRNRYFCVILYEEDENYEKYLENIMKKFEEVTYIKHDRDITETGEKKKEHIHILFKVGENARTIKAVAKDIEIAENYIQGCNKKAMLLYLIHANNPEKTQYNVNEVHGELKKELIKLMENRKEEEERIEPIIEAINKKEIKTIAELLKYAINKNKLQLIRKYQYILIKMLEEKKKYEKI